jgi:hypothetical protein
VNGGSMRDQRFEVENEAVMATLNQIATSIGGSLDKGWGFTLLLFEYGADGTMFYISSAERGDVVKTVREWLEKQEAEHGV